MHVRLVFAAIASLCVATPARSDDFQSGTIPHPVILMPPPADVRSEIVLISDSDGWTPDLQTTAERLKDAGAIVIGIDLADWTNSINATTEDCHYLVSDIESLGHQVQRSLKNTTLQRPVIAGLGAGGALALGIAAQTPPSTAVGTVAVDPTDTVTLDAPLCTEAARRKAPDGTVYQLSSGNLPDPIGVWFTPAAPAAGKAHVDDLRKSWPAISVETADDVGSAITAALTPVNAAPSGTDAASRLTALPLTILPATASKGLMAVVYSGDGGWRDLDRQIGLYLSRKGIPTVGVDSLSYFWSTQTPDGTASDLASIMDVYGVEWGAVSVILVGYSFGADILPSTYLALDPAHRKMVRQMSLLALSESGSYEITVDGWLGSDDGGPSTIDDLKKTDLSIVQCFYGISDPDAACPDLRGTAAEIVETDGGHHFDGNYDALAEKIIAGPTSEAQTNEPLSSDRLLVPKR